MSSMAQVDKCGMTGALPAPKKDILFLEKGIFFRSLVFFIAMKHHVMPHCLARGASTKENTSKATSLAKGRWFHTKNLCSRLYAMGHRNIVPVCKLQGLEDSERL